MNPIRLLTAVGKLAAHLREEIQSGGLDGKKPGLAQLVRSLGVGTKTVVAALVSLKHEGVPEAGGARRRSRIMAVDHAGKAGMRVRILLFEEGTNSRIPAMRRGTTG